MSVIYEALKKAQQEASEPVTLPAQWCPEFIFVNRDLKREGRWKHGKRVGLVTALFFFLGLGLYWAWPTMREWLAHVPGFSAYVKGASVSIAALGERAQAAYVQGNIPEAVRLWEELLARGQADALLYNHLGLGHKKLGHLDKAEAYDRKALDLDPNNAETMNNLGVVYLEQNRLEEALVMLEKALQKNPAYADPHFHLGRLYEKQGRVADAIRAYTVFLERYPDPGSSVGEKVRVRIEALGRAP